MRGWKWPRPGQWRAGPLQDTDRFCRRVVPLSHHQLESRARAHLPHATDRQIVFLHEWDGDVEHLRRDIQPALFDVEIREVAPSARVQLVDLLGPRVEDRGISSRPEESPLSTTP